MAAAAMDEEMESILDSFRRFYTPTDEELAEDYAGMTRGERADAMKKREEHLEYHLLHGFLSRWAKPNPPAGASDAERAADSLRRRNAYSTLTRELFRFRSIATVEEVDFSGMGEEERAVEAARRRRNALEEARRAGSRSMEASAAILDFDPKQGGSYYNRLCFFDLTEFDLDKESHLGPMRFADRVYKNDDDFKRMLCPAINILSVKIASSDVGFPIHVYGTVIVRDSVDEKCLYLFRRDKEHCQIINSEEESLILTGPKRGLVLFDYNYVELDLKIKDHQGQERELSKGFLQICGRRFRSKECMVERESLATRLSTVDVRYAYMGCALEATIAIERVLGDFYGEITAHTSSICDNIVLYDSKLDDVQTSVPKGAIQLIRSVVAVPLKDMLYIVVQGDDGKPGHTIRFTPWAKGVKEELIYVGAMKLRVKVIWSTMFL